MFPGLGCSRCLFGTVLWVGDDQTFEKSLFNFALRIGVGQSGVQRLWLASHGYQENFVSISGCEHRTTVLGRTADRRSEPNQYRDTEDECDSDSEGFLHAQVLPSHRGTNRQE